jgi:hypothetical protein
MSHPTISLQEHSLKTRLESLKDQLKNGKHSRKRLSYIYGELRLVSSKLEKIKGAA